MVVVVGMVVVAMVVVAVVLQVRITRNFSPAFLALR